MKVITATDMVERTSHLHQNSVSMKRAEGSAPSPEVGPQNRTGTGLHALNHSRVPSNHAAPMREWRDRVRLVKDRTSLKYLPPIKTDGMSLGVFDNIVGEHCGQRKVIKCFLWPSLWFMKRAIREIFSHVTLPRRHRLPLQ